MTAPYFEPVRVADLVASGMNAVVDAAALIGVTLPARQVMAAGPVPYDCEQVVVFAVQLATGAPESRSGAGTYPNYEANVTLYTGQLTLVIVRKSLAAMGGSNGTVPPSPEAYLANLQAASADTAVLLAAANKLHGDGFTLDAYAAPRTVTYAPPQGGMVATSCRVGSLA